MTKSIRMFILLGLVTGLTGCGPVWDVRKRMYDQEKFEPLEKTTFFGDNRASRLPVEGTVARDTLRFDKHMFDGQAPGADGKLADATTFPFEITEADLQRGQQRYDIFCSVCHGKTGIGNGMVVKRGYKVPPSLHDPRLANAAPGYLYKIASRGIGTMAGYADQISVEDRWRVVAYLKTLQFSQKVDAGEFNKVSEWVKKRYATARGGHGEDDHGTTHDEHGQTHDGHHQEEKPVEPKPEPGPQPEPRPEPKPEPAPAIFIPSPPPPLPDDAPEDARKGQALMAAATIQPGCWTCHSVKPGEEALAPSLADVFGQKGEFESAPAIDSKDEAYIRESILDPGKKVVKGYKDKSTMAAMAAIYSKLPDDQVKLLVAYIKYLGQNK